MKLSQKNSNRSHGFRRLFVLSLLATGFIIARTTVAQDAPAPAPSAAPAAPPTSPPPAESAPAAPDSPAASAPAEPPPVVVPPPPPAPSAVPPPPVATVPPAPPPVATLPPPPSPVAAPPAAEQPATKPAEKSEKPESEDEDSDGIFGPFRIGPVVGVGVPSVVSVGGTIKLTRYLGAGVNIGIIPQVKVSLYGDATLSYQEYDAYGRIYPFGGSFFIGAGVGYATMKGKFTNNLNSDTIAAVGGIPAGVIPSDFSASLTSEASVRAMVLTPQIGFFSTWGSGFSLGIDVGAQVPIAPSEIKFASHANIDPAYQTYVQGLLNDNDKKVTDTLNKIGQTVIPTMNLRMGWLL